MYNKEKKEMKKQRKKTRRAVLQRTRADLRKLDGPMVAGLLAIPIRNRFRRDITLRYCLVVLITKNTGMCTRSGAVRQWPEPYRPTIFWVYTGFGNHPSVLFISSFCFSSSVTRLSVWFFYISFIFLFGTPSVP